MAGQTEVSALRGQKQDKKVRELSNNRLADASAGKSADKSAASAGMMAAAAPAPVPPAKAAQAAPAAEPGMTPINAPPGAVAETVTVEAAPAPVRWRRRPQSGKRKTSRARTKPKKKFRLQRRWERQCSGWEIGRRTHSQTTAEARFRLPCQAVACGQQFAPLDALRRRRSAALFRFRQDLADDSGGEQHRLPRAGGK